MIRIGLIGASRIAGPALLRPAQVEGMPAQIVAVAARDVDRAKTYAAQWAIPEACDYDALLARADIDLVYISTPPSNHGELGRRALAAGKHVLMEKPFSFSAQDTQITLDAAARAGKRLIEATHYIYHPTVARFLEAVREIGPVKRIEARIDSAAPRTPDEIRWRPELAGGALRDIGFYPLHMVRSIMRAEPESVRVLSRVDTEEGVDAAMEAALTFPGGVEAAIGCDMLSDLPPRADVRVIGERGKTRLSAFGQPRFGSLSIETEAGVTRIESDKTYTYVFQLRAVCAAIATGAPLPTEGADILGQAKALDALYGARPEARRVV